MKLNFPSYNFKIKKIENTNYIFDVIRKIWLVLTPEEWVRQHVIWYLIQEKKYPSNLMAVEKRIKINNQNKRFDLVVFNLNAQPFLLAEFKAPNVKVGIDSFIQAGHYNQVIGAGYLLITNGINTTVWDYQLQTNKSILPIEIPEYHK